MDPQRPIYPQRVGKKSVGLIYAMAPKNVKIDIGSMKNVSAASDLPPEGPKKKRWADLTHLAHFEELANFEDFGDFAHLADVVFFLFVGSCP